MRGRHVRAHTIPLVVGAVLAIGAVGFALVTVIAGLTGEITRATVAVDATEATLIETQTGCAGVMVVAGDVTLDFPNALDGEYCRFTAAWVNNGSRAVRLQDVAAPEGASVAFPAAACGTIIDPAMTASVETTVTLETGDGPVAFDGSVDGLVWVPTQNFDAGLCPSG